MSRHHRDLNLAERDLNLPGDSVAVGDRVADWLRQEYPRASLKEVGRDLDVSHHTVKKWMAGARPENQHFDRMVKRWGAAFVAYCYGLAEAWGEPAVQREMEDLRRRVERLEGGGR